MGMKNHAAKFWLQTTNLERGSLILFTAFMFLGIRSYAIWPVGWGYTTRDGLNTFLSAREQIFWKHRPYAQDDYINATGPTSRFLLLNAGWSKTPVPHGFLWTISVPYGLLWIVTAIAPLSALRRYVKACRRTSRILANRCIKCGYDLSATPDQCPECGTIPPKEKII